MLGTNSKLDATTGSPLVILCSKQPEVRLSCSALCCAPTLRPHPSHWDAVLSGASHPDPAQGCPGLRVCLPFAALTLSLTSSTDSQHHMPCPGPPCLPRHLDGRLQATQRLAPCGPPRPPPRVHHLPRHHLLERQQLLRSHAQHAGKPCHVPALHCTRVHPEPKL